MIQPFRLMTFRLMAHSLIAAHAPMCLYPLSLALLCLYPLSLSLCSGSTEGERGDAGILSVPHVVVSSLSPLSLRLPKAQAHDLPRPSPPLPFSLLPGAPPAAPPAGKRRGGRGWGRGGRRPRRRRRASRAAAPPSTPPAMPSPRREYRYLGAGAVIWGGCPALNPARSSAQPCDWTPVGGPGRVLPSLCTTATPGTRDTRGYSRHPVLATPVSRVPGNWGVSRTEGGEYPVSGGYHRQREGSTRELGGILCRGPRGPLDIIGEGLRAPGTRARRAMLASLNRGLPGMRARRAMRASTHPRTHSQP